MFGCLVLRNERISASLFGTLKVAKIQNFLRTEITFEFERTRTNSNEEKNKPTDLYFLSECTLNDKKVKKLKINKTLIIS